MFFKVRMDYGKSNLMKKNTRGNTKMNKVYIALFVCTRVKVIYIEILAELMIDKFLADLDHFVVRPAVRYFTIFTQVTDCSTI